METKEIKYYVYYLKDPISNDIRYVGISKNPKRRYYSHLSPYFSKENSHKTNWINKLKSNNLKPTLEIAYEFLSLKECKLKEIELISTIENLTNIKSGGDLNEGIVWTPQARLAAAQRGLNRLGRKVLVTYPCGKEENITNISEFCRTHNLTRSLVFHVLKGKKGKHKNFKFKYADMENAPCYEYKGHNYEGLKRYNESRRK